MRDWLNRRAPLTREQSERIVWNELAVTVEERRERVNGRLEGYEEVMSKSRRAKAQLRGCYE